MRGLLAILVACATLWAGAGAAVAATVISFDDGEPRFVRPYALGIETHGLYFANLGHSTILTDETDRSLVGFAAVRPVGRGSFEPLSLDLKINPRGAVAPTTLAVRYWMPNKHQEYAFFALPASITTDFVTIDLSPLGTVLEMRYGFGFPFVTGGSKHPCHNGCITGFGPYSLTDNFTFDNVVVDAALGVPEPSTWTMMLLGFFGVAIALRRQSAIRPRPC